MAWYCRWWFGDIICSGMVLLGPALTSAHAATSLVRHLSCASLGLDRSPHASTGGGSRASGRA